MARLEALRRVMGIEPFTAETAEHHADIFAELSQSGTMIPQNDIAVAATARCLGCVVADSFAEAEAETRAYWRAASLAERLNAPERLREPFYGKDQIGGRLQRFLEVVPCRLKSASWSSAATR